MNNNRLIVVLLIFSFALNIGIIAYLIYEHNSHNLINRYVPDKTSYKRIKTMRDRMIRKRKEMSDRYGKIKFSKEERKKIRGFFIKLHKDMREKIREQIRLKKELYNSFQSGDIEKAKEILTIIHKNQKEIDIRFLSEALNLVKEFPPEKRKIVSIMIFRIIGRKR
jgi:hypothetical protein